MRALRETALYISGAALLENARLIRRHLGNKARMMAVVKADGYGHGLVQTARTALAGGADALAVAFVEEGVVLREAGIRAQILVLGASSPAGLREAVRYHLAQAVYEPDAILILHAEAARLDSVAHAHVKIDTGMTRLGLRGDEALEACCA